MLAYLDRSNLGNANITSMPTDIGLTGNQFGTAVTLFYATYAPAEAPMGILLKIVGPNYLLSFCAFSWGLTTLCMGFIRNVGGLYTCRLLLGVFEAAIVPSFDVYIGYVYKKSERGKRVTVVYCFSALASAFGGLLVTLPIGIKVIKGIWFNTIDRTKRVSGMEMVVHCRGSINHHPHPTLPSCFPQGASHSLVPDGRGKGDHAHAVS